MSHLFRVIGTVAVLAALAASTPARATPTLVAQPAHGAGTCLSCRWLALDLSNLFIGSTDLELSGFLTGTLPSGANFRVDLTAVTESWAYQRQIAGSPIVTGIVDAPATPPGSSAPRSACSAAAWPAGASKRTAFLVLAFTPLAASLR